MSTTLVGNTAFPSSPDTSPVTVNGVQVDRTRINIADPTAPAGLATVGNAAPAGTEYGLITRNIPSGTQPVSGNVGVTSLPSLVAGTAAIGTVGVTALPALPAGTAAIGTVGVTSLPALPAGANAIGSVNTEGQTPTYVMTVSQLGPAATPTDVVIIQGSATKLVRIKRVILSGTATTASTIAVYLLRRNSANSGGTTAAPPVPLPHDPNDPAATAAAAYYTANPTTLGGLSGYVYNGRLALVASGTAPDRLVLDYTNRNSKAILLRGAAQFFALNLNSQTIPAGGVFDLTVEWTEE